MHLRDFFYAFIFARLPSVAYSITIVKKEKKTNLVLLSIKLKKYILLYLFLFPYLFYLMDETNFKAEFQTYHLKIKLS